MSFSERSGITPPRPIQRGTMDGRLRNGLWNAIDALLQRLGISDEAFLTIGTHAATPDVAFLEHAWEHFFGAARDQFRNIQPSALWVRQWFYGAPWNEVYDLIEYMAGRTKAKSRFIEECNAVMKGERAAYQLVGGKVLELTDEGQIKAVEDALSAAGPVPEVQRQLQKALARLADRPEADCTNAIKEAVSAVETLAGIIGGCPGKTLAEALKLLESRKTIPLHSALNRGWASIFGYASDVARHGLKPGQPEAELEEALYLVVSCSAFVSYLIGLANRAGVELRASG